MKHKFLDRLAGGWLKKQDTFNALKKIGERGNWKAQVKKCHDKLSAEYKFWVTKTTSPGKRARVEDLSADIAFIKKLEQKETITAAEQNRLKELVQKYGIS